MQAGLARVAVAVALLAILASTALASGAGAQRHGAPIVILVTDRCDETYVEALLAGWGVEAKVVRGLEDLPTVLHAENPPVLVAPDPNWGPGDRGAAAEAREAVIDYTRRGGIVITDINGFYLLKEALASRGVGFIELSYAPLGALPPGYNASKYKVLALYGDGVERAPGGYYIVERGRGYIVIMPYNVVWAYCDTHDHTYIEMLLNATRIRPSRSPAAREYVTAAVAGLVALGLSTPQGVRGRGRRVIAVLYPRLSPERALEHRARTAIVEALKRRGASYLRELMEELGLPKGTLAWHLYVLESRGIISSLRWKRYTIYYINDSGGLKSLVSRLAREDPLFCRALLMLSEGLELGEVARRTRLSLGSIRELSAILPSLRGLLGECRG